ncbi:MAG: PAS domain S-box protein [Deltaproteobacteria bacterium]|nr:PAS domain S-box protein [Deltaproteobacteria bacterium]
MKQAEESSALAADLALLRQRVAELESREAGLHRELEEFRASEARYRRIAEEAPISIMCFDREGLITFVNSWHLQVFARRRHSPDHFLGTSIFELPGLKQGGAGPQVARILEGESLLLEDVRIQAFSGGQPGYVTIRGVPLFNEGEVVGGILLREEVSTRVQAQKSMRESENKFRTLTETAASAIFIIQEGRVIYANPAAATLWGCHLEEWGDRSFWDTLHPEHRALAQHLATGELEEPGTCVQYEFKILTKDGQEKWVDFTAGYVEHQGRPALLGTAFDISAYKRATLALEESEKRLTDIINFLPDPTFAVNRQGELTIWNRAMEELSGLAAGDMLGKGNYEHALPFWGVRRPILVDLAMDWNEDIEKLYPFVQRDNHTLFTEAFVPHIRPGGAYLWGKAAVLYDSQMNIVGAIETVRDITTRKAMEDALRESAERHQALVQNLPTGVISVDANFRVTEVNQEGQKILGLAPEEVVGQFCGQVLRSKACETTCPLRQAVAAGAPYGPVDTMFLNREGQPVPVRLRAAALYDQNGALTGGVEVFQDISEIKAMERERANLISMFAHDMKSPLVGIQGFAVRLLRRGGEEDLEKRMQYLEMIRREAGRLEAVINDFLDFARLETGSLKLNLSATDLDKEFYELFETFEPRFQQAGITLHLAVRDKLPVVEADASHLKRAFSNLLENALKYSETGTEVTMEGEETPDEVLLRFHDQGRGIPAEELPYIFDVFYRGREQEGMTTRQGHGLGLAGVEAIVKGHGGRVLVASEVGRGSVFTVALPKRSSEREAAA